jgi:hypothetical protein
MDETSGSEVNMEKIAETTVHMNKKRTTEP